MSMSHIDFRHDSDFTASDFISRPLLFASYDDEHASASLILLRDD